MAMHPLRKQARIAGLLYLFVVLAGPFVLLYVPGKLFVTGDAAATARNILAHETMFRTHIAVGLVSQLCFVGVVLALYRLLRRIDVALATGMVILLLIDAPLAFLSIAHEVATLSFLRVPGFLAVFEPPQREAITLLLLELGRKGTLVSQVFWGLWLLPLGVLVHRSGFLPRLLGTWLFANGLAYLALSATGLFWPAQHAALFRIATPILFAEMALMLWLLIVGARVPDEEVTAT